MQLVRTAAALLACILALTCCAGPKSQHEQAVEWIAFYSGIAQQVQADAHLLQIAIGNLYLGATDDRCQAVKATAGMVAGDLAAEPAGFAARLGPGRVSDAVAALAPATTSLRSALEKVGTVCTSPAGERQRVVDQYGRSAAKWNTELATIWVGANRPLPPVLDL